MKNRLTSLEHREGSGLVRYLLAVFFMLSGGANIMSKQPLALRPG